MKTFLKIVGILVLTAVAIVLLLLSLQGFIGMFDRYGWPAVKFFGAGFLAFVAMGGAGELCTSLFRDLVDQDKWHNTMLYKLGRAIGIRTKRKAIGTVEYVLENWN